MHRLSNMPEDSIAEVLRDSIADAQEHPHMATGLVALSSSIAALAWLRRFCLLA